jgi:hypothetical protein
LTNKSNHARHIETSQGEVSGSALVKQVVELFVWNFYKSGMSGLNKAIGFVRVYFDIQGTPIGEFDLPDETELLKIGKKWCRKCVQTKFIESEFNKATNLYCIACVSKQKRYDSNLIHKNQKAAKAGEKVCKKCKLPKSIVQEFIDEQKIEREHCHRCREAKRKWLRNYRSIPKHIKKQKWEIQGTAFVQDISLSFN